MQNKQQRLAVKLALAVWVMALAAVVLGMVLWTGLVATQRRAEAAREAEREALTGDVFLLLAPQEETPVSRYAPITEAERELIARMVWLEARGESAEGQQAVAEVILNRVAADNFPATVEEVLLAPGQFTPARLLEEATPGAEQYGAVDGALWGENILPMDVVYFSQRAENDRVWGTIGGHVFCYQYVW